MPCDSQRNRMNDKKDAWDNAKTDLETARAAALIADAAMVGFCEAAILTGGTVVPLDVACAGAIIALAIAAAKFEGAKEKEKTAKNAYNKAKNEYDNCMSKQKPAKAA